MNTKMIKIIICMMIAICLFSTINVSKAVDEVAFSVSSTSGKSGDEVTININLDTASNFASANFVLEYDTTKLTYVSYTEGEVLETAAMCIVNNNPDTGKIAIGYIADPTATDQTKEPGNMLKIVFRIESTTTETTDLNLVCSELKDDPGTDIPNTINQGKIEISGTSNSSENEQIAGTNTINTNTSTSTNTSANTSGTDNTKTDKVLPNTGLSNKVFIIGVIIISCAIVSYRKYQYFKGIK